MSHHLLPLGGQPPLGDTRGHHCNYMEQLRRSVAQLAHQTASKSPSSCTSLSSPCGSDFGRRSSSRSSADTLYHSSVSSPECLVVYEPHVVVERREQLPAGYVSSSSSSGSGSPTLEESRLGDVSSDIFEDSGVDLGFPNLQTPWIMQQQYLKHQKHLQQQQQLQHLHQQHHQQQPQLQHHHQHNHQHNHQRQLPSYKQHQQLHQHQQHQQHQHQHQHQEQQHTQHQHYQHPRKHIEHQYPIYSNIHEGGEHYYHQSQLEQQQKKPQESDMYRHSQQYPQEHKGLYHKPKEMNHQRHPETHLKGNKDHSPRHLQSEHHNGQMVDKSTHTHIVEVGGVCFCAVEVRKPKKNTESMSSHSPKGDMVPHNSKQNYLADPSKSQRQIDQGHYDVPRSVLSKTSGASNKPYTKVSPTGEAYDPFTNNTEQSLRTCSEELSDDDTPTATPTPEDEEEHSAKSFSTQGCQTERSVLRKESPRETLIGNPQGGGNPYPHTRNGDVQRELLRTSMEHIPEPKRTSKSGSSQSKKSGVSSGYDVTKSADIAPEPVERPPSVTSLISMTDTMSVTSLEVANIMAVSSKEDKKSAVKLEKERLQLQHQRLESYQLSCPEDSLKRQPWPDKGRKPYSEESLKKQKILKSVLETLPSNSAPGSDNQSHLHHFVTQSLESFFTGATRKPSKPQESHGSEKGGTTNGNYPLGNSQGQRTESSKGRVQGGAGYVDVSTSPKHADLPVPMPSLFQLTASFRLFHVTYGDWTDLRNLRLYLSDLTLEENNSRSPSNSSRSPGSTSRSPGSSSRSSGSPGARSVASVLSSESGAFRAVGKHSPAGHYTFMVISSLGNPRMELDPGGLKVGDHIIEVNDMCMLNRTPEVFYSVLRKLPQVHLVIGRRRPGLSANQMASCDSSML